VTIFKPNKKEIQKKIPFLFENNVPDLKRVSDYIFSKLDCEISVITLGEDGLWIANRSSCFWIKGIKQEISDVSGAGDAVISSLVWSLIKQVDLETMGNIANAAGAQVCARSGVVSLELHSFTTYYLNLYTVLNK
jgi:bifunctional ADP-heptose synthase (sugar kinase/adenylyltransferase)